MKQKAHESSASDFEKTADVVYKNEKNVGTFVPKITDVSSGESYQYTTFKSARTITGASKASVAFSLNIKTINRKESNYRTNRKLSGRSSEVISTEND